MNSIFKIDTDKLNLDNFHLRGKLLGFSQEVSRVFNQKFKTYSPFLRFSPKQKLLDRWKQEAQLQSLESDYEQNLVYKYNNFRSDKVIHLLVDLTTPDSFPELAGTLRVLSDLLAEQVILHLVSDFDLSKLWAEFSQTYEQDINLLGAKLFLGSVIGKEYLTSQKVADQALTARVMVQPSLAAENEYYTTIDEYLKVHFQTRYYENYEIYKPEFLNSLESLPSISQQIQMILDLNHKLGQQSPFPCDLRNYSVGLNDEVWILNLNSPELETTAKYLTLIAKDFNLQTQITYTKVNHKNKLTLETGLFEDINSNLLEKELSQFKIIYTDPDSIFATLSKDSKPSTSKDLKSSLKQARLVDLTGDLSDSDSLKIVLEKIQSKPNNSILIDTDNQILMTDELFSLYSSKEFSKSTQDLDIELARFLNHDFSNVTGFTVVDLLSWLKFS
jgi:hypothetical protein